MWVGSWVGSVLKLKHMLYIAAMDSSNTMRSHYYRESLVAFVTKAEAAKPGLFQRDGSLLKRLPVSSRLDQSQMIRSLNVSMSERPFIPLDQLLSFPDRACASYFRSLAYINESSDLALKDALACLAHLPGSKSGNALKPFAHELVAAAFMKRGSVSAAFLHLICSRECQSANPAFSSYIKEKIHSLCDKLDQPVLDYLSGRSIPLDSCSSEGFQLALDFIEEENRPLLKKKDREPFEFYSLMMERRIKEALSLEGCQDEIRELVKKTDVDDLLVLMQQPTLSILHDRVEEMRQITKSGGLPALMALPPPSRLTYDQVQQLQDKR